MKKSYGQVSYSFGLLFYNYYYVSAGLPSGGYGLTMFCSSQSNEGEASRQGQGGISGKKKNISKPVFKNEATPSRKLNGINSFIEINGLTSEINLLRKRHLL